MGQPEEDEPTPAPGEVDLVFIHPSDELYGADRMLLQMFEALSPEQRAHTEFWLPTDMRHGSFRLCEELRGRGARVHHVDLPILRRAYRGPRQLGRLLLRCVRLRRELRRVAPATVYCTTSAAFLGGPVARLARVPHVVGHVQELWSEGDRRVLGRLARAFDHLLAISEPVREGLGPALRDRTTVVLNSVPGPAHRTSLTGRGGPLRFVVASRWNGWKGHRTLLRAWDRLEEPGELVVLGGPPPSGASVDVPTLVSQLRRPESVRLVGEVQDPAPYLRDADVVVLPSDDPEPFGLVAIEAFAQGRPVVASQGGGLADVVTDGHNGWLFPPRDSNSLTEVLRGLTRERVLAAGIAAAETYDTRFTEERYAQEWQVAARLP